MRSNAVRLLLVAAVLLLGWWVSAQGAGEQDTATSQESSSQESSSQESSSQESGSQESGSGTAPEGAATDPESGLDWIEVSDLPAEALDTIALIEQGGPFPYRCCDDTTFRNDEGLLPDNPRGYYREYTVETPGSDDRGARRIVVGDLGEFYWTDDHYASFDRIRPDESGGFS